MTFFGFFVLFFPLLGKQHDATTVEHRCIINLTGSCRPTQEKATSVQGSARVTNSVILMNGLRLVKRGGICRSESLRMNKASRSCTARGYCKNGSAFLAYRSGLRQAI
jgi:hypothetical protein